MPGSPSGDSMQSLTAIADEVLNMAHGNRRVAVQHAIIDENVSGSNEVVAAVAGKYIVVLAYNYMAAGAVNAHWRSAATPISGPAYMDAAGSGKVVPYNPKGWCKTATGEALNLQLSGNVAVGGELTYVALEP